MTGTVRRGGGFCSFSARRCSISAGVGCGLPPPPSGGGVGGALTLRAGGGGGANFEDAVDAVELAPQLLAVRRLAGITRRVVRKRRAELVAVAARLLGVEAARRPVVGRRETIGRDDALSRRRRGGEKKKRGERRLQRRSDCGRVRLEKRQHGHVELAAENLREAVAAARKELQLGAADEPRQLLGEIGGRHIVVGGADDKRRRLDARQLGDAVEGEDRLDAADDDVGMGEIREVLRLDEAKLLVVLRDVPGGIEEEVRGLDVGLGDRASSALPCAC